MQNNQLQRSRSPYTALPPQMVQSQQLSNPNYPYFQNQLPQTQTKTNLQQTNYVQQQVSQQQQSSQRIMTSQQNTQIQQTNYTQQQVQQQQQQSQRIVSSQQNTQNQQIISNPISLRNGPQSLRNNQVEPIQIIQNKATQSPVGPLSMKANKSWSGQKPAFVEYMPPVFIPRPEPLIQQTIVEKPIQVVDLIQFEDIWNKRIKGLENMLAQRTSVEPEPLELRAVQADDSDKVYELQNELFSVRSQLEDRDREIVDLRAQLQSAIEQLEYEKHLSRNSQSNALAELELKIKNLQQANANLQTDLKQTTESLQRYRIENNQLQTERQYYKDQCDQKDEIIGQLQQEILEYQQHIEQLQEEVTTTSSVQTYEAEAKIWKQKFKELNDTYHACQEKLMIRDAEYESLMKSQTQQKVVTQTIIQSSSSNRKIDSDYLKNSFGTTEINDIQKPLML